MAKRIFDGISFFNELEVLDLRLHTMADHVDYFIIAESTRTHQNQPKPLVYEQNKARYARFQDKIIHVVVDDMPDGPDPRQREQHQRRAIARGLTGIAPEDIVIVSDADEILRPSTLRTLRERDGYFLFDMPMFQFFLNARAIPSGWNKSFAFSHHLANRVPDWSRVRVLQLPTFEAFAGENHKIEHAGWHFTFLGGADRVREKLDSYIHRGEVEAALHQPGAAERRLASGYDIGGGRITRIVEIDDSFPDYILDNLGMYREMGFIKPLPVRVRELEDMFTRSENQRRAMLRDMRAALTDVSTAGDQDAVARIVARCESQLAGAWRVE